MSVPHRHSTIAFIGGGPRATGLVERLIANAALLTPETRLTLLIFDPHPAGPGRIWRYDQSPSLRMNSLAEDVALYNDPSCVITGPHVPGPTLAEWIERVRSGEIDFTPPDPLVVEEISRLGPQGFTTRRLTSCYLRWFYEDVVSRAPDNFTIREIRAHVDRVIDHDDHQTLEYRDNAGVTGIAECDIVVYAVGHTESEPTPQERETTRIAGSLGLHYWPTHFANEADFGAIPGGETVLMRGIGLSFVDIVVRLTIDRGGVQHFDPSQPIGQRMTYDPSGKEPRLVVGSRRGVPYHSKITSHLKGEKPGLATTFFTRDALREILDAHPETDFWAHVWPLICKEMAWWHYREIFTGFPGRAPGDWEALSAVFAEEEWGSERLREAIRRAVAPDDIFDIDALDRPLEGKWFASLDALQAHLTGYILNDLYVREAEEHSETLALFWGILASVVVIGDLLGHPNWSAETRSRTLPHWWHGFFSYVDSGPPAERLELILALMRRGILVFGGGEFTVEIDRERKLFAARSGQHPEEITSRYLIDGFQPDRSIEQSVEPVLRDLIESGQGYELLLGEGERAITTGRLAVDFERANILRPDGTPHPRRFALGDFTAGPPAGAFARPGTNARIFRENDSVARTLLEAVVMVNESLVASRW